MIKEGKFVNGEMHGYGRIISTVGYTVGDFAFNETHGQAVQRN